MEETSERDKPFDSMIVIRYKKEDWKKDYTFKARLSMRIIAFILPGFLKITIK